MSGRTSYLAMRGAMFQLRLPIPSDLHCSFGRKELRWSLQTRDPKSARRRTLRATLFFQDLCSHIRRMPTAQPADIASITHRFYASLMADHPLPGPIAADELDRVEYHQAGIAEELASGYHDQIERRDYSTEIRRGAEEAMAQAGGHFGDLTPNEKQQLLEGVARATIEYVRYTRFRQASALDPYEASDHLFERSSGLQASALAAPRQALAPSAPRRGGSGGEVGELIQLYLKKGVETGTTARGQWKPKTRDEKAKSLKWFAELVGPVTDVREITPDHVRKFRDAVDGLKKGSSASATLKENHTSIAKNRIQPDTALKLFGFAKEFLGWLAQDGYLDEAPGRNITVPVPKKAKSEQRRPFTPEELDLFFSSPLFTGCKSVKRRAAKGDKVFRDDEFWMPLVLLHTGMRLAEPLQIAAEDVVVDGEHPHFRLVAGKINLKNHGSERKVPIHPDLIELGFLDFVRSRQAANPKQRLFRNIVSQGEVANYYSQRLGRYLREIGITDKRVVTHSFRHYAKDVMRDAKVPKDASDQITGHSSGTVSESYGKGASIATLSEYMAKCDFGLSEPVKAALRPPSKKT